MRNIPERNGIFLVYVYIRRKYGMIKVVTERNRYNREVI